MAESKCISSSHNSSKKTKNATAVMSARERNGLAHFRIFATTSRSNRHYKAKPGRSDEGGTEKTNATWSLRQTISENWKL